MILIGYTYKFKDILMSKNQSVKVAIRIRPLNRRQRDMDSPVCVDNVENVLNIRKDKDIKEFIFDYVFGIDTRQQNIYEACAFGIVESALDGFNGTVFAYGQTGAGKTFTMVGDYKDPEIKGIIPRAFDHVIQAIHTSQDKKFVIRASFIEIYNQDIMDLLEDKNKNNSAKKDLKQNPGKGVYIKDLKMIPVKSVDQLFKILDLGNKNRTVHSTAMNAVSSRSHAIFTVHVQSLEGADKVKASKINLVDLAGSERQSKTEATGDRLKQGAKINLSLTALGNVINSLVDGKKGGHIPYRDSKLTRLLQDSLGGNTKTLMIASVSPAADNYDETVSTLRYAARARNIKNTPKVNEDPKDAMIRQYLQEIEKLKKQLTGQGGFSSQGLSQSGISQQEFKKAQQQADEKGKQLLKKEQQMRELKQKLKEMEELVLKKQEVSPEIVKQRKIKKKKAQKQEQLIEQRLQQINEQQNKLLNQEKQVQEDKKIDGKAPEERAEYWKRLAKQLREKLKRAVQDKEDIQKQFEVDREDLNKTIRLLQSELSLYKQVSEKFLTEAQITTLRENAKYDEEKRNYDLPPFLMREETLSLPKSLKINQIEDLWNEKKKNYKFQLFQSLPSVQTKPQQKQRVSLGNRTFYKEVKGSNLLRQRRKVFELPDYEDPKYKQKQYDVNMLQNNSSEFRRTKFRINDRSESQSRSRSRSNTKLQPLMFRPVSSQGQKQQQSTSSPQVSSRGRRFEPLRKL